MNFMTKKEELLKEALSFKNPGDISGKFERGFFSLLEDVIIEQIQNEDTFFGNFMLKTSRRIKLNMGYPISTKPTFNGFIMYFDPLLILECDIKEIGALIKHEIYHIMFLHYERMTELKDSYSKEAINAAIDISVNSFIKHLPMGAMTLRNANMTYKVDLKEDMPMEYYVKEIQESIDKRSINSDKAVNEVESRKTGEYDIKSAHDEWENIDLDVQMIEELTKRVAKSSDKEGSPDSIKAILKKYTRESEISWQDVLKRVIPTVKRGYKKTIVRRDRRQFDRLDLRGILRDVIPEVIVAIDISASMSDEEFKKIIGEIISLSKSRAAKVKIIECDDEVRRVYSLKNVKEIKERCKKNGATAFSPVFEYVKKHRLSDRPIIYFTDGVGEKILKFKPKRKEVIWVLTGKDDLSLDEPFGCIKRFKRDIKKEENKAAGIEMYKEVTKDQWIIF